MDNETKELVDLTTEELGQLFPIEIVPYDKKWSEFFSEEKKLIQRTLGEMVALRIEHFGSTAIEGIASKPNVEDGREEMKEYLLAGFPVFAATVHAGRIHKYHLAMICRFNTQNKMPCGLRFARRDAKFWPDHVVEQVVPLEDGDGRATGFVGAPQVEPSQRQIGEDVRVVQRPRAPDGDPGLRRRRCDGNAGEQRRADDGRQR